MAEKSFVISSSNNPEDFRVMLYKATTPNVVAYYQDIPAPHPTSQPIVFTNIDDATYIVRIYEWLAGGIQGQKLFDELSKAKQKDFQQEPNLEIVADTDMASGQNVFDGSATFPQYTGLVVNVDYYVERQGQGTFKEVTDVPPFGFSLNIDSDGNPVNFNPLEKFTIHFYPKVKITQTIQSTTLVEEVIELNADTVLDAIHLNSIIDINSATNKIRIELDYLANFPDGSYIKFMTNRGNQVNAVIAAKPGEEILFNQSTSIGFGNVAPVANTDIVMGNNEYLKLSKKGSLCYVDYFTGSYDNVGDIVLGTRLKHNYLLADGAVTTNNEIDPNVFVRLYREVEKMSGVLTSKALWLDDRTKFYNDAVLGKIGIPDLRGWSPRFLDGGTGIDADRVTANLHNIVLSIQQDELKKHGHTIRTSDSNRSGNINADPVRSSSGGSISDRGNEDNTGSNTKTIGSHGGTETRGKNVAFLPLIKI